MSIDLSRLAKEVQDKLIMKESLDSTFGNALAQDYTKIFFDTLTERKNPQVSHSYLASWIGTQGSGKSYSALATCGFLDKDFNLAKIYFDINELVNDRHKLKSHSCVLVDEQSRQYGIDSNRINIMLQTMKEQLRKKSIHMIYCSPTLKEEYKTSMYVIETMFIDKEQQLSFHAYKTNELMTLGYIAVPHPKHFISDELIKQYEAKKDEHLDEVLTAPKDDVEERAKIIMADDMFKKAEKVYIESRGFIPKQMLIQLVERIFPEFKGSVVVYEVADRVKFIKETDGTWAIFGSSKKD